jgi:hypothetical protein
MHYFYTYPWLSLATAAFTVWMLIDCYRRGSDQVWFWIILFFPLLGPFAYFFAVKARDFQGHDGWSWLQRRPSVEELRFHAEQTPSLANRLALAERLLEKGEYPEATPHLEAARKTEPDHGRVLYSLAICHTRQGRPGEAVPLLEKLIAKDPRWSNYAAWPALAEARRECGDHLGGLEAAREVVRLAPTLEHRCLLAEYLLDEGLTDEARSLLDEALRDHDFAPGPVRRRNRRWARVARQLQKRIASV